MQNFFDLSEHFRLLYKPENWFSGTKSNCFPPCTNDTFILTADLFPGLTRTFRQMYPSVFPGERYLVVDDYASPDSAVLRVVTHVFSSVPAAREGFFRLLWVPARLKSRENGILEVGEVSYGSPGQLLFLRNNIAVRITCRKALNGVNSVPEQIAFRIDQRITECSVIHG